MKKRVVIGYLYFGDFGKDEKVFDSLSKKKGIELVMINLSKDFNETILKDKLKDCKVVFCNTAETFAVEFIKTLEEFGKKVIDSSKSHLYIQDKWMLYLECEKRHVLCPKTILLSEELNVIRKQIGDLNIWPIVLKKLDGTMGEYIEKADNIDQAIEIMKNFYGNNEERFPVIAQEFIASSSYRVTVIDKKIIQTALKSGTGWKCTGVYSKNIKKFKVDKKLSSLVKKIMGFVDIKVCGLDFLKKDNKWILLEVNSEPAFDFFESERNKVISQVLDYLKKEAKK